MAFFTTLLAQAQTGPCKPGQGGSTTINGQTICNPLLGPNINSVADIINIILPFLYGIAGVILFLIMIWGGYDFLLSQGDPEKVEGARGKITAGIIGFVLLIISYVLVKIIAYVFGLQNGII